MFRKMRRIKQQLTQQECVQVLKNEPRGVLSMMGENGYPYGIPMDHWYCEEDGKLYFHGAVEGHKIDAIAQCDKVSYCVMDKGYREPGEWPLHIKSVIVFGRLHTVSDKEKTVQICTEIGKKFTNDEAYLQRELAGSLSRVLCLELTPEYITGKLVKES